MLVINAPASVTLRAICGVGTPSLLRNTIEQQIAERVRGKVQPAIAAVGGDLQVDVAHVLLQGKHGEVVAFPLVLVQLRAVKVAYAVYRETLGRLPWIVGDLKLAFETTQDQAEPRVWIKNAGDVGEAMKLVRGVMKRVVAGGRGLATTGGMQKVAGDE